MCVVDTPEIPKSDPTTKDKPLPIIRNPYLDGLLGNIAALRGGRNALRIDLINPLTIPGGGSPGGVGGGSGSGGSGGSSGGFSGGGVGTGGSRGGAWSKTSGSDNPIEL